MKKDLHPLWNHLRAAYRPAEPGLDPDAIMGAIRREAAAVPREMPAAEPLATIPAWICVATAALAIFAAGFVVGRAFSEADEHISRAWMKSVPLNEFEQTFLDFPLPEMESSDPAL